jgi:hypothetical protein
MRRNEIYFLEVNQQQQQKEFAIIINNNNNNISIFIIMKII